MALYRLTDNERNNMLAFLSRVKFDGANNFVEVDAIQEIRLALSKPILEEVKEKENKDSD